MRDIRHKSIGFLIDEYITSQFKFNILQTEETKLRKEMLLAIIISNYAFQWSTDNTLAALYHDLYTVSFQCFQAQDEIHRLKNTNKYKELSRAAITAQETNARRNEFIRLIDKHLGEEDITPLEKTYV